MRQQIGIVFQEPVLFDRSIADNIRYGANHRDVGMDKVEAAAKDANIHNFVKSLPMVSVVPGGEWCGVPGRELYGVMCPEECVLSHAGVVYFHHKLNLCRYALLKSASSALPLKLPCSYR